jgi:hypothetical protein
MIALCVAWSWTVDRLRLLLAEVRHRVRSLSGGRRLPPGRIKHVFVLVLENRSFDHMLGFADVSGRDAVTGEPTHVDDLTREGPHANPDPQAGDRDVSASRPAAFALARDRGDGTHPPDPGHEFENVLLQLCGYTRDGSGAIAPPAYPDRNGRYPAIDNSGFIASYLGLANVHGVVPNRTDPESIMHCFDPKQVPVLTALAKEFAVCDRWFSSMPGPTWPNRFFLHAATSGGLDDSPSSFQSASATFLDGYRFENGTIFDRLEESRYDWKVFMGDEFPQVFAIGGMTARRLEGHFRRFDEFAEAVNDPEFSTPYVFIEPNYGNILPTKPKDFTSGDSQHPLDDITHGERLVKQVYETIRNSPHWNESLLLVTYDEHGGFFDHVPPPAAEPPGDTIVRPENNHHNFDFGQLGVRVPAIAISPLIPANTVDHTTYDHTSLLATVEGLFGFEPMTRRDAAANSLEHLLSLASPRTDAPTALPDPADSGIPPGAHDAVEGDGPLTSIQRAFLHVAFLRHYRRTSLFGKPGAIRAFQRIRTRAQADGFIREVRDRLCGALRRSTPGPGPGTPAGAPRA